MPTDNEIIKALECHKTDYDNACIECPYIIKGCSCEMCKDTLNLINRQKAEIESNKAKIKISAECIARQDKEIERLQTENRILSQKRVNLFERLEIVNDAREKAIKEFAERLVSQLSTEIEGYYGEIVWADDIDNLVKEMVGDNRA